MDFSAYFILGLCFIGLLLLLGYRKYHHVFRCVLFTAVTGLAALGMLWFTGRWVFSVPFAITPFTAAFAGILGVPGVLFLLLFRLL